jgi:hypothetical protein
MKELIQKEETPKYNFKSQWGKARPANGVRPTKDALNGRWINLKISLAPHFSAVIESSKHD